MTSCERAANLLRSFLASFIFQRGKISISILLLLYVRTFVLYLRGKKRKKGKKEKRKKGKKEKRKNGRKEQRKKEKRKWKKEKGKRRKEKRKRKKEKRKMKKEPLSSSLLCLTFFFHSSFKLTLRPRLIFSKSNRFHSQFTAITLVCMKATKLRLIVEHQLVFCTIS